MFSCERRQWMDIDTRTMGFGPGPALAGRGTSPVGAAPPTIRVTDQDWRRLTSLITLSIGRWKPEACAALDDGLARAEVVPTRAVRPDVVTMNSQVAFELGEGGERRVRTLVYPWDADHHLDGLSVLSPLGSALLGRSVGDAIHRSLSDGAVMHVRVLEIPYQPEAAGDWLL